MGKVRNQRHRMAGTGGALPQRAPERSLINLGGAGAMDLSGLESNLGSIEENKRLQACQLISDICKMNGHSSKVMDKLTNRKILAKFVMRLVDHSVRVKLAAFSTLQILSSVSNSDVTARLVTSGIFRAALTTTTDIVDLTQPELLDIKQNALYTVANIISSQPVAVQEIIDHKLDFFEFLLSNLSAGNNISILNTCLNVLNILSRSVQNERLINHLLGPRTIGVVQELLHSLLQGKSTLDPLTSTIILSVSTITTADQDLWIVVIQCLEIMSNFYVHALASMEVQQCVDIRNIMNIAIQLLGLASAGIVVLEDENLTQSRENDLVEMMSEFFSNISSRVNSYIQGLEDDQGRLRQPADRPLHIRMVYIGTLLSTTRTPTFDSITAFLAVWQQLQRRLRSQMMTADAYAEMRAQHHPVDAEDDDVMVSDHADPDMAITNPATANAPVRTMPTNLMGANWVLSHDAVSTIQVLEKAQNALGELLSLQSCMIVVPSDVPSMPTNPHLSWESFFAHASFLQEALDNTTPSMDATSRKAVEGWMTAEEEDLASLKASVVAQCVAFFDILTTLISHTALTLPSKEAIWLMKEEQLRACVILLVQWLSAPQLEICLSVLATASSFSKDNWCGSGVFPAALFGVLTNALVNRLRQSTAFSTSSSRDGSNGGSAVTLNKSQNVQRATILLLDGVLNALIDLHSSDHLVYHEFYQRMNLSSVLDQQRNDFVQRIQRNIFLLNESERDQLEDTMANIDGLLEYKRSNFR